MRWKQGPRMSSPPKHHHHRHHHSLHTLVRLIACSNKERGSDSNGTTWNTHTRSSIGMFLLKRSVWVMISECSMDGDKDGDGDGEMHDSWWDGDGDGSWRWVSTPRMGWMGRRRPRSKIIRRRLGRASEVKEHGHLRHLRLVVMLFLCCFSWLQMNTPTRMKST